MRAYLRNLGTITFGNTYLVHTNSLSNKVILNYLSSLKSAARQYKWDLSHTISFHLTLDLSPSTTPLPLPLGPCGIFALRTMTLISTTCNILDAPPPHFIELPFCWHFFAFLRMSNEAPIPDSNLILIDTNFLRQNVIFHHPGTHVLRKWTKTLQETSFHHCVQIPLITNRTLCPVRAHQELMQSRPLSPLSPLSWSSSTVWTYLQNTSQAPSIVPLTFAYVIPSHL